MKKILYAVSGVFVTALLAITLNITCNACSGESSSVANAEQQRHRDLPRVKAEQKDSKKDFPLGVQALMASYPDFIKDYDGTNVIFTDGTTMEYDDGKEKSFVVMLDNGDLEDMFYVPYVLPKNGVVPEFQADAGRSRCDPLFKKMYGSTAGAVQKTLTNVNWMGKNVQFTRVNGAADSLRKVAAELQRHPELRKYLTSSGTFYWRPVRGAKRLSAHSYGIAFDIGVDHSDYWLWKNGNRADENAKVKYANRIPVEIAEIFQKYGFIWGGAWYHFDTMHFEFRPEILKYAELVKNRKQ